MKCDGTDSRATGTATGCRRKPNNDSASAMHAVVARSSNAGVLPPNTASGHALVRIRAAYREEQHRSSVGFSNPVGLGYLLQQVPRSLQGNSTSEGAVDRARPVVFSPHSDLQGNSSSQRRAVTLRRAYSGHPSTRYHNLDSLPAVPGCWKARATCHVEEQVRELVARWSLGGKIRGTVVAGTGPDPDSRYLARAPGAVDATPPCPPFADPHVVVLLLLRLLLLLRIMLNPVVVVRRR
jgi:hypothetical protein